MLTYLPARVLTSLGSSKPYGAGYAHDAQRDLRYLCSSNQIGLLVSGALPGILPIDFNLSPKLHPRHG